MALPDPRPSEDFVTTERAIDPRAQPPINLAGLTSTPKATTTKGRCHHRHVDGPCKPYPHCPERTTEIHVREPSTLPQTTSRDEKA